MNVRSSLRSSHEMTRRRQGKGRRGDSERGGEDFRAETEVHVTSSVDELVTELFHGDERVDEHRQLLAEPPDVDVDGPGAAGVSITPDVAPAGDRAKLPARGARERTGAA